MVPVREMKVVLQAATQHQSLAPCLVKFSYAEASEMHKHRQPAQNILDIDDASNSSKDSENDIVVIDGGLTSTSVTCTGVDVHPHGTCSASLVTGQQAPARQHGVLEQQNIQPEQREEEQQQEHVPQSANQPSLPPSDHQDALQALQGAQEQQQGQHPTQHKSSRKRKAQEYGSYASNITPYAEQRPRRSAAQLVLRAHAHLIVGSRYQATIPALPPAPKPSGPSEMSRQEKRMIGRALPKLPELSPDQWDKRDKRTLARLAPIFRDPAFYDMNEEEIAQSKFLHSADRSSGNDKDKGASGSGSSKR